MRNLPVHRNYVVVVAAKRLMSPLNYVLAVDLPSSSVKETITNVLPCVLYVYVAMQMSHYLATFHQYSIQFKFKLLLTIG